MKMYINDKKKVSAYSASIAMAWYRQGYNVRVETYDETGHKKSVLVHGKQQPKRDENLEHCKHIAKHLEEIYNGEYLRCPECGETLYTVGQEIGDKYCCPECGHVTDSDDFEEETLWEYFNDCYDIEYRIGSDKQLRSVKIMVACGGPNIYIDTATKQVELYWWGDRASYPIDYDTCNEIDSIFEEYYNC